LAMKPCRKSVVKKFVQSNLLLKRVKRTECKHTAALSEAVVCKHMAQREEIFEN